MGQETIVVYAIEQFVINSTGMLYLILALGGRKNEFVSPKINSILYYVFSITNMMAFVIATCLYLNTRAYYYIRFFGVVFAILILWLFLEGMLIKKLFVFLSMDFFVLPAYFTVLFSQSAIKKLLPDINFGYGISLFYIVRLVLLTILSLVTMWILRKQLKKFQTVTIKNNVFLWLILIFIYGMNMLGKLPNFYFYLSKKTLILSFVWSMLLASIVALVYQLLKNNQLKQEQYYYILQKNLLSEHSYSVKNQMEMTRKFRHDIANHIQTLCILKKSLKEASKSYTDFPTLPKDFTPAFKSPGQGWYCNNLVVQTAIQNKIQECHEKQISVEIEMQEVDVSHFYEIDLLGLMYNLFDNAIDACVQIPDKEARKIRMHCSNIQEEIQLDIINTMSYHSILKPMSKTSKSDKKRHGVGLSIMKNIVKKYQGKMTIQQKNNIFQIHILLKGDTE